MGNLFISAAVALTVAGYSISSSAKSARDEASATIKRIADDFESKKAEIERNVEQKVLLGVSNRLMELRFLSDAERKIAVASVTYWTVNPSNASANSRINRLKNRGFKNISEHKGTVAIGASKIAILDLDADVVAAFSAAGFADLEAGLNHIKNQARLFIIYINGNLDRTKFDALLGDQYILANHPLTLVSHAVAATQAMEAFQNPRLP